MPAKQNKEKELRKSVSPVKDGKSGSRIDKLFGSPAGNIKIRGVSKQVGETQVDRDQGTTQPTDSEVQPSWLAGLMEAIQKCDGSVKDLTMQVGTMGSEVSRMRVDLTKIREHVKESEKRLSSLEEEVWGMKKEMVMLADDNKRCKAKLVDLEDRSRRANLRIVGFPEGAEGKEICYFIETWLLATLGKEHMSANFSIERAHRVPAKPPAPGGLPRPIILKLLSARDRDLILRRSRDLGTLVYNGNNIAIYPDYAAETRRLRAQYQAVKKRLQSNKIKYGLLFPARMRLEYQGKSWFFSTPVEASDWMDRNGLI